MSELGDEELAAIEQMVAAGDLGGEGYNVGVAFSNHDLTRQDTSVGVNVTAIEQINDRLHRFMRIGLLEELRYNARLQPARTEIVRYADYVSGTSPPLAVNVTKIDPLRGECLVVIHSQVVFSCLDNWFGGSPKSLTSVPAGRIFTPTESAVINKIRGVIPADIGKLTNLKKLSLRSNKLEGSCALLSPPRGESRSLRVVLSFTRPLPLRRASPAGRVPSELKQLTRLEKLWIGGNSALEKPPGCPLDDGGFMYYNDKKKVAAFLACLP